MGSSKKHKEKDREHKRKRKHRSKSRDRDGKRRHKDREEGVDRREVDYSRYGHAPDRELREEGEIEEDYARESGRSSKSAINSTGEGLALSIGETNKLRAKLGLKPLEIPTGEPKPEKESLKDDLHAPAENWGQMRQTEKLRERLERQKQKRHVAEKLGKVKTLGESDSDEDAATWVRRNRMKQREKDRADKTAKMLEEMDAEFGIGSLVEEEFKPTQKKYTSRDLRGLKVEHDLGAFTEGQTVILTLKDRGILDEGDADAETLINMNMLDKEIADKNVENRKKKPAYNPYDDAEEDEYGMIKAKEVLSKYDEEIQGERRKKFQLGSGGVYNTAQDRQMDRIMEDLRSQSHRLSSEMTLAKEYMTAEEAEATFKKVKKKVRKIRKKKVLKADDLLPLSNHTTYGYDGVPIKQEFAAAPIPGLDLVPGDAADSPAVLSDVEMDADSDDDYGPDVDLGGVVVDDEAEQELHAALNKARKVKQKSDHRKYPEKIAEQIKPEPIDDENDEVADGANIVLNSTSEFCRALGDIPTYGQAGNRDELEQDELAEFEQELQERRRQQMDEEPTGWNRVEIDETPVNLEGEEKLALEEEPMATSGVAGALMVAMNKGYLEHEQINAHRISKQIEDLQAQNYSIEDKRYDDLDDKYKKRDRFSGFLQEFKDKEGYKPDVHLEYFDETGRDLNQKEAFRQLSHRFHGKGSGKKKTEKRAKKLDEKILMLQMNITDTPLNTVALLKDKQLQEKTPYIVLSGNKGFTNPMVKPQT